MAIPTEPSTASPGFFFVSLGRVEGLADVPTVAAPDLGSLWSKAYASPYHIDPVLVRIELYAQSGCILHGLVCL